MKLYSLIGNLEVLCSSLPLSTAEVENGKNDSTTFHVTKLQRHIIIIIDNNNFPDNFLLVFIEPLLYILLVI